VQREPSWLALIDNASASTQGARPLGDSSVAGDHSRRLRLCSLLVLIASSTAAAAGGSTLVLTAPQNVDLGMTAPLGLQRLVNGQPDTNGSLSYAVTTSNAGGFGTVALMPNDGRVLWDTSFMAPIDAGQSTSDTFFYRGAIPGVHTLTVAAGMPDQTMAQVNVSRWIVAIDFESPLRLGDTPPGPVNTEFNSATTITCEIADGGALRGKGALLLDDTNVNDLQVARVHAIQPTRESFWFRAWNREVVPSGAGGSWRVFELSGFNNPDPLVINDSKELIAFSLHPGQLHVQIGNGPTDQFLEVARPDAGVWHLYEAQVLGLGTTAASAHWAIDGVEGMPFEPLDWSAVHRALTYVAFGGVFRWDIGSTPSQLWTDDLAVAIDPLASQMQLSAAATSTAGSCVPVTVWGVSTFDGGAAQSPFDLTVSLDVLSGNASFFSDTACTQPTATVAFARGDLQRSVWLEPVSEGTLSVRASGASLLPGPVLTLTVRDGGNTGSDGGTTMSDGGTTQSDGGMMRSDGGGTTRSDGGAPPTHGLALGCGCETSPHLAAALLFLVLARRRRPRPGSNGQ
jgi:MYXO-CTERM domain-containing protein